MHHDVAGEHARGAALKPKHLADLERQFVHPDHLARDYEDMGAPVLLDQVVFAGARFHFAREVRGGAGAEAAFTFTAWDEHGDLADIAAWKPPHVALWLGRVAMLGEEQLHRPRLGESLLVHQTPLEWFRCNRQGIVILDHHEAAPMLRATGTLEVADADYARELRRLLTTPPPCIVVGRPAAQPAHAA